MKIQTTILGVILSILVFTGCSKNDPSVNATRLRVHLTDAAAPIISEMNIHIQRIEVSTVNSDDNTETWTTLNFNGGTYNILTLSNGKSRQLVDQYFPVGVLRRMKIVFGTNSSLRVAKDSQSAPESKVMVLDPKAEEGIIVNVNANLYANYISSIIIDINGALSFYESNGNYFLKPVVRVFPEIYGGSLKGYALPKEAKPIVVITKDKDKLLSIPEPDGMFLFKGLAVGEWEISVLADPESGYKDTTFVEKIIDGKLTELKSKITLKKKNP